MSIRILCINKAGGDHANKHEAIEYFGWIDEGSGKQGKASRADMVKFLEDKGVAYVKEGGSTAFCGVRTSVNGLKFVQTYSDGTYNDNLLSLMECR